VTRSLWNLTPASQEYALEWYEAGLLEGRRAGYEAGYRDGFIDGAAAFRDQMERAAQITGWANALLPSYSELCRRRGEHERAERNDALLRERGVA